MPNEQPPLPFRQVIIGIAVAEKNLIEAHPECANRIGALFGRIYSAVEKIAEQERRTLGERQEELMLSGDIVRDIASHVHRIMIAISDDSWEQKLRRKVLEESPSVRRN